MLFYKTKKKEKNSSTSIHYFLGIPIYKIVKSTFTKTTFLLGFQIKQKVITQFECCDTIKSILSSDTLNQNIIGMEFILNILKNNEQATRTELWFDHAVGGGTEVYTKNYYDTHSNVLFIRVQNAGFEEFIVTSAYENSESTMIIKNISELEEFSKLLVLDEIVINNLAFYCDTLQVLSLTHSLKTQNNLITFKAHDFYPICPNFTMVNNLGNFCDIKTMTNCLTCLQKSDMQNKTGYSMEEWHAGWESFFVETVDKIIAFSTSTQQLFSGLLPQTANKTVIIPHSVAPLRAITVSSHPSINIGVLGTINYNKGLGILAEMANLLKDADLLKDKASTKIIVFGKLSSKLSKNVIEYGKYNRNDLPNLLEENQIDIIFIPSICPETFSYTTSEAMLMDVPVACFNLGAQAEKVKNYNKGLIIDKVDAKIALDEIQNFILNSRNHN